MLSEYGGEEQGIKPSPWMQSVPQATVSSLVKSIKKLAGLAMIDAIDTSKVGSSYADVIGKLKAFIAKIS